MKTSDGVTKLKRKKTTLRLLEEHYEALFIPFGKANNGKTQTQTQALEANTAEIFLTF